MTTLRKALIRAAALGGPLAYVFLETAGRGWP